MKAVDRQGREIVIGSEVVWASSHMGDSILKRGIVAFLVLTEESWNKERVCMTIRTYIQQFNWRGRAVKSYLARRSSSGEKTAEAIVFHNLEVIA